MPKEAPGTLIGAYHIEGALTENSCGSDALPAADPLTFDVQIRKDKQGGGLWLRGMPPARPGRLGEDGSFSFEAESAFDAKPANGAEPIESVYEQDPGELTDPELVERLQMQAMQSCRLLITETIDGHMLRMAEIADASADSGVAEPKASDDDDEDSGDDLVGVNEISIRAQPGSNCGLVLATMGGPFLALPCRAHYDLTGTLASK
jgi:hypothetical protein